MPFRYGIISSPAERIAAQKSPCGKRKPADESPFGQSLDRVLRASRREPAARRSFQRRDILLIKTKKKNERPCKYRHSHSPPPRTPRTSSPVFSSGAISVDFAVAALSRATMITSNPADAVRRVITSRHDARRMRFMRLRTTALPLPFVTVNPRRHGRSGRVLTQYMTIYLPAYFFPFLYARKNVLFSHTESIFMIASV